MTEPSTESSSGEVTDPETHPSSAAAPRRWTRSIGTTLVLSVLVYAGMSLYGDVAQLGAALGEYRWSAFGLGLVGATLNYLLRYVRWELYLRALGIRDVPKLESFRIFVAGFVMSITPGKVGEVFKSVLLFESRGHPVAKTAPIVVAERLTDLIALVALAALGASVLDEGAWISGVAGVLVLGIWLACAWRPLGEFGLRVAAKLPLGAKLEPVLRDAYESLRVVVAPGLLALTSLISLCSWFLECVSLYWIAQGFVGIEITLLEATFIYSVPTLVGALAMLPGGLGATEASMTGALERMVEASAAKATAITLLVRLATLWWAVVLGALALVWHRAALRRAG